MRMPIVGLAVAFLIGYSVNVAQAQRLDHDTCWSCQDSWEHFAAGAGIDAGLQIVFPKTKPWQRVIIVTLVGSVYEVGQESVARSHGLFGPGYGFGLKDLAMDVAGAIVTESIVALTKRVLREIHD